MYIFPGYVAYYENKAGNAIYISSLLLKNKVMLTDPAIQDEFRALVKSGGRQELTTPLTKFLHEQELFLTEDEIFATLIKVKGLLNNTLMLTIMPTEGCNFRCPYCYEDHTSAPMSRETLNCIQRYIEEQAPRFKNICINWFGGEPTLCKDIILNTNALVQNLQTKHHFQFKSGMTTNGYLLDKQSFREYYAVGINNYQITLDGWNHDQSRPHVSGKGTLHTIINHLSQITALPQNEYQFKVILRRNILGGDMDFTWYDYLNQLFGKDKRFFMSVVPVSDWGGNTVKELNLLTKEAKGEILSAHTTYVDKIGMQREKDTKSLFSNVCYASYPYGFVFRSDGRVEKCTIAQNHPKNFVGYVDPEKGIIIDDEINRLWTTNDLNPECCMCSHVLSCLNLTCKHRVIINGELTGVCPRVEPGLV